MRIRYNPKCLVASGLVVGGYWLLAPSDRRVTIALALAVATYAGLAHYDRLYNCDERLESFGGPVSVVTGPFKPALDADNRYTGGATPDARRANLRAPKLAGGCGARNGECG
jgi:hypothetical protein